MRLPLIVGTAVGGALDSGERAKQLGIPERELARTQAMQYEMLSEV